MDEQNVIDMADYLRVYDDSEYNQIKNFMAIAENYVDSMVGQGYKNDPVGVNLADILIKKLVDDMYNNRGTAIEGKRDILVTSILDRLSIYED